MVPMRSTAPEPKAKELVLCALDPAATYLYRPSVKTHMCNALRCGATHHEIMEVLEIVSVIGIHGVLMATPVLEHAFQVSDESLPSQEFAAS
jgi:alkylhydroperoxidase/carboxymuconolactone decarboxylase family protein YurZ